MNYRIAIGTDHRGYELKESIVKHHTIGIHAIDWVDVGTFNTDRTDYPPFAIEVSKLILLKKVDYGILLCGTGVGMAIVANRFPGIYAGLVWSEELAKLAKEDDNVNVLVLPADFIKMENVLPILQAWLTAQFQAGRYEKRIEMIDTIKLQ